MPSSQSDSYKPEIRQIFRHNFTGSSPDPEPLRIANDAPPWRTFHRKTTVNGPFQERPMLEEQARRGRLYQTEEIEAQIVSAALVLRRPLLVAGHAGVGKTSLAYAVAWQLGLGNVLRWSITSRSTLKDALYEYDAIGRLQDASLRQSGIEQINPQNIGQYITLGPLGTGLLPNKSGPYQPRVLLIDEIDKSDIDLPNDLLHVLEEGVFEIAEIARFKSSNEEGVVTVRTWRGLGTVDIPASGVVTCDDFPLVILTTNGEREFSPAFRRRCLEITIPRPDRKKLDRIVRYQLNMQGKLDPRVQDLLEIFERKMRDERFGIAVDQLLNAIYLTQSKSDFNFEEHSILLDSLFHSLTE